MNAKGILFIIAALMLPIQGQQSLDSTYRSTGASVVAAFETQRQVLQTSSAVILDGRREIGYGVVISADGYILAKASEVQQAKALAVTVDHTNYREVKSMAVDATWDVVILKIEASGLQPVVYAPTSAVPQGTWVVANGATTRTTRRLLAGIVSAKIREIPAAGGAALGVVLKAKSKSLEVAEVNDKGGAIEAGLQPGDVILAIDGKRVSKPEEISTALVKNKAGSIVKLSFRRKGGEMTAEVRLSARAELFADPDDRNDQMSGDFSPRRSGFQRVLQHDILGGRSVVGGPLLDLEGRCIGMNIARANRAESYAIPAEELKELAERLMK
ncbi:MAG: PDZ domain-containing protein [Verrucomicrobiota bacterium]